MRTGTRDRYWLGVIGCAWAATLLVSAPASAQDSGGSPEKWQIEVTPYFFAAGFDGTAGVNGVTSNVHMGVGDVLDRLDGAFMGMVEMRKGPWSLVFDGGYMHLKEEASKTWSGPGGIGTSTGELTADATEEIYGLYVGHRIDQGASRVDFFGGLRFTRIETHLDLVSSTGGSLPGATNSVSDEQSWFDPIIGFRIIVPFAEQWSAVGYADIGGFGVGSVLTSQSLIGVNWELTKTFVAKLGYRYLYQNYDNNDFTWDMLTSGPYLGVGIRF